MNSANSRYVVITPVRNEAPYIGKTIESMVRQTMLPVEWIIVDDGSTDATLQIIEEAAKHYVWIRVITLPTHATHSFAAVVHAIEAGVHAVTVNDYHYLGIIDGDVKFKPNYFHNVIERFEKFPALGLGGGMVVDVNERKLQKPRNLNDVPGATQFFRRSCFEALGGLIPVPEGGWDALTCAKARMLGYETLLFTDLIVEHMKPRNISQGGLIHRLWQMGVRDYALGYHLIFEFFKCASRLTDPPIILGAIIWLAGFLTSNLARRKRFIKDDLIKHIRSEQIRRLMNIIKDIRL